MKMNASKPEPMPKPGQKSILIDVMTDLLDRDKVGRKKYGTPLQTFNGRNGLMDAYQEALDLVMYLKQTLLENETKDAKKKGEKASLHLFVKTPAFRSNGLNISVKLVDKNGKTVYEFNPFYFVKSGDKLVIDGLRFDADFIKAIREGVVKE